MLPIFYAFEKKDAFGFEKQVIHFKSYGSGKFFWEWSVGGVLETGSSNMSWEVNDDVITVEYIYESKYGGNTHEELNLKINNNNTNSLTAYGSDVYKKISSYSQKKASKSDNLIDASDRVNDLSYCSLCNGTGIEKNTAQDIFGGESGRTCPMCDGTGKRSY